MYKYYPIKLLSLIGICFIFLNLKCNEYDPGETAYKPLFIDRAVLESSIKLEAPKELERPAKIYTKDGYIFISESYKGIHIIDNKNPQSPQNIGFIKVIGCLDMAIKGTTIYVDNATDLVSIDASDPKNILVSNRQKNVFPEPEPPDLLSIPVQYNKENRPPNLILVDWVLK